MTRNRFALLALVAAAVLLGRSPATAATPCPPDPFLQATTIPLGGPVNAVAAGDFTGDSIPDILATSPDIGVLLLKGHGDGTFDAPILVDPAYGGYSIVAADFDGNGTLDFATGGGGGSRFTSATAMGPLRPQSPTTRPAPGSSGFSPST